MICNQNTGPPAYIPYYTYIHIFFLAVKQQMINIKEKDILKVIQNNVNHPILV